MTILAIETTGVACGVSLMRDGITVGSVETDVPNIHDVQLLRAAREVKRAAGISLDEIDVVAVSAGPGSFTGTRIGVSFAKGLTMLNSPKLLGVSTLESLAYATSIQMSAPYPYFIVAMIPSHRDQVFLQRFRIIGKDEWEAMSEILSIPASTATTLIKESDIIIGPGATLSSIAIAQLAHIKITNGSAQYADPLTFVPDYRQDFK